MPVPILINAVQKGRETVRFIGPLLRIGPWIAVVALIRYVLGGARNRSERNMHGKVVMITGGTSGVGGALARELAERGAQLVLLTQQSPSDPFLVDFVDDLRESTKNELIYAEQVDLASLHSVRTFATRWIDNTPPRRLDAVVLCASTLTPRFAKGATRAQTLDGVEPCWGVNCLSVVQLLRILSPALRAQPPDRDVRIIVATCTGAAQGAGNLQRLKDSTSPLPAGNEFASSALARIVLARHFQRHLDSFTRADKQPNNARVALVDPGRARTPGMRRWLSGGSLWGLLLYIVLWPLAWLVLKSAEQGAQSFLYACMEANLAMGPGGRFVRECRELDGPRESIAGDEKVGTELWDFAEKQIAALEKQGAVKRALAKKEAEEREKRHGGAKVVKTEHVAGQGKVLGEVDADDAVAASTGQQERQAGSRRSRKAK